MRSAEIRRSLGSGSAGYRYQPAGVAPCGARFISKPDATESGPAKGGCLFLGVQTRISGSSAHSKNDLVRADESDRTSLRGQTRLHFLHERADVFLGRTPPRDSTTVLRFVGAGRLFFPGTFGN